MVLGQLHVGPGGPADLRHDPARDHSSDVQPGHRAQLVRPVQGHRRGSPSPLRANPRRHCHVGNPADASCCCLANLSGPPSACEGAQRVCPAGARSLAGGHQQGPDGESTQPCPSDRVDQCATIASGGDQVGQHDGRGTQQAVPAVPGDVAVRAELGPQPVELSRKTRFPRCFSNATSRRISGIQF